MINIEYIYCKFLLIEQILFFNLKLKKNQVHYKNKIKFISYIKIVVTYYEPVPIAPETPPQTPEIHVVTITGLTLIIT